MSWAEQPLSFASRIFGLGRDFVRLYHPHGPRGTRRKKEARFGLRSLEKIWPNICVLPRAFMWYQPRSSQGKNHLPLTTSLCQQLTVATPTSTAASDHSGAVFSSNMCTLPTHSLSLAVGINSPCQEACSAWPGVCLAPTGLPVKPAKAISTRGGDTGMTGSGSSVRRRFSSGGGQLRNSHCIMLLEIPRWFEVTPLCPSDPDPHLIPSHVRAHPVLANLLFIFSPQGTCSCLLLCRSSLLGHRSVPPALHGKDVG